MLTIHVWPRRLKEFLLTHPLYKSPSRRIVSEHVNHISQDEVIMDIKRRKTLRTV